MREIQEFLEYLIYERNLSRHTITNYEVDLKEFYQFLGDKKINEVDVEILRLYLKHLYNQKYMASSISRKVSALKSYFKFLESENKIDSNPMVLISNPKKEKKLPNYLNPKDLDKLLEAPDLNTTDGQMEALILEMLYSTGIRVSELVNIKTKDIDFDEQKILVLGKGNKERYVYYGSRCGELLDMFLNGGKRFLPPSDYLVSNKHGEKLNDRMVRMMIEKLTKKANLDVHVTPHVLRHTYATHMLNEGADLKSVGDLLGHENLSTTQIYTHVSNERLRNVYLASHPRAKKE